MNVHTLAARRGGPHGQVAHRRRRRARRGRLAGRRSRTCSTRRTSSARPRASGCEPAIAELGYRPHAAARGCARAAARRSASISIRIAGGISGVVLDRFVHALTERASERGMRMLIYAARTADEEIARLGDLVDGAEIDAVVITGTFFGDPRTGWLHERDVPFVSFGRRGAVTTSTARRTPGSTSTARPARVRPRAMCSPRRATRRIPRLAARIGTGDDRERGWREAMTDAGASGPRFDGRWTSVARAVMSAGTRIAADADSMPSCARATRSRSARISPLLMPVVPTCPSSASTTRPSRRHWASPAWSSRPNSLRPRY